MKIISPNTYYNKFREKCQRYFTLYSFVDKPTTKKVGKSTKKVSEPKPNLSFHKKLEKRFINSV